MDVGKGGRRERVGGRERGRPPRPPRPLLPAHIEIIPYYEVGDQEYVRVPLLHTGSALQQRRASCIKRGPIIRRTQLQIKREMKDD